METNPANVVPVATDADVDAAVATLVLAFDSDPFTRWVYDDPRQYLQYGPRLFRAIVLSSLKARGAQRTVDGFGAASWLPPGVSGDDGPIRAIVAESVAADKQAELGAAIHEAERYRPDVPHWYLSTIGVDAAHRGKACGTTLLQHRLRQCDDDHLPAYLWSSNPKNLPFYERDGFEVASAIQTGSGPSILAMLRAAR